MRNFRNYKECDFRPERTLTVLVGPNASGKTNIIEAIQIITTGTSFRSPRWDDVVRWGESAALISMTAEGEGSHCDVGLHITSSAEKKWTVGGVARRRVADATRFVPVVLFTPDDLWLVKGPAENRRSQLDTLGDQLSATHQRLRRDYAHVLRQRNTLLREGGSPAEMAAWDDQLIRLGARLHVHRRRLAARIRLEALPVYEQLAQGERLDIQLIGRSGSLPSDLEEEVALSRAEGAMADELERRRSDEQSRQVSLVGPHRDDFLFLIGGRDARAYASQGQQRTVALAWKWAEVSVITEMMHRAPVLLLDDVMSELDQERRRALTGLVQRAVQTFVTTTTTAYFEEDLLHEASVIDIRSLY